MARFTLRLTEFKFPEDIENSHANFRFLVDVRYMDKGVFKSENVTMPGLDTFWECSTDEDDEPNFVRSYSKQKGNKKKYHNSFDMKLVKEWDKVIIDFIGDKLIGIRFKVFDVNRTL